MAISLASSKRARSSLIRLGPLLAALTAASLAPALAQQGQQPEADSLRIDKNPLAIKLSWQEQIRRPPYAIFRSSSPQDLTTPENFHAVTGELSYDDLVEVAEGPILYYKIAKSLACTADSECGNFNACDGAERCNPRGQDTNQDFPANLCIPGPPIACDDGDPCSLDYCSPGSSACVSTAPDCNDFDACTRDICEPGVGCRFEFATKIGNRVELSGNPLPDYPQFEYATSFNENAPIDLTVDTSRWRRVIGKTCDAYVVEQRGTQAWCADRGLTDVRGAPQTVSFISGSVADNVQNLAAASTIPFDVEGELGRPYDVVLDCDLDGSLDRNELVDGLGDQAGLWVVRDLSAAGPLTVNQFDEIGPVGPQCDVSVSGSNDDMRVYYPDTLDADGATDVYPLAVISHGNGHCFDWYDYLGQHIASYGYIVMAHDNDAAPGIDSASQSTLDFTDRILLEQATLGGGVLDGHIDDSRIVWIGHSRGGEGVVRARDRLVTDGYAPLAFEAADVLALIAIAPTDFLGPNAGGRPHDTPFQLVYGAADGDVCGCPTDLASQAFLLFERAEGERQSTYIQGADHNDFNCCGPDDFTGPAETEIGPAEAQQVAKAAILAMLEKHVRGSAPADDFLWRQYESFRPIGVSPSTTVVHDYRPAADSVAFVVDDYQTQTVTDISSSGGLVTYTVSNLSEDKTKDTDLLFDWTGSDVMNGMTRARSNEFWRGVTFDFSSGDSVYELEIIPAERDLSDDQWLSFRAAQMPRHPETTAALEDLVFTVTLIDGSGASSSIRIDAYGGGIEEPYQRTSFGEGAGWQAEFETIRIRLTDFKANRPGFDLSNVDAIRFDFGASYGSPRGRIAIDDVVIQGVDLCPDDSQKGDPGLCGCGVPEGSC